MRMNASPVGLWVMDVGCRCWGSGLRVKCSISQGNRITLSLWNCQLRGTLYVIMYDGTCVCAHVRICTPSMIHYMIDIMTTQWTPACNQNPYNFCLYKPPRLPRPVLVTITSSHYLWVLRISSIIKNTSLAANTNFESVAGDLRHQDNRVTYDVALQITNIFAHARGRDCALLGQLLQMK